jgi:hypothetical protein
MDVILGKARRERGRLQDILIKSPLNAAGMGEHARGGVGERLPGPREDPRVVAPDLKAEVFVAAPGSVIEHAAPFPAVEEGIERLRAPLAERRQDAISVIGLRREGIVEERLEIPSKLGQKVRPRASFHGKAGRRRTATLGVRLPLPGSSTSNCGGSLPGSCRTRRT